MKLQVHQRPTLGDVTNHFIVGSSVCLYDMEHDPCETNNLAAFIKYVVKDMKRRLVLYRANLSPQLNKDPDIVHADPQLFNYTWNPWVNCFDDACTQ